MGVVASAASRGVEMVAGPLIRSAETAVVTYVRPIATRVAEEVVTQVGSIAGQTVADQLQSAINAGLNIADAAGSAPGGIRDPNAANALITAQNNALLLMMGLPIPGPIHAPPIPGPGETSAERAARDAAAAAVAEAAAAALANTVPGPVVVPMAGSENMTLGRAVTDPLAPPAPMDPTGPGAFQGEPQPIPQVVVPTGSVVQEIEPRRVYNEDHSTLPPVMQMPTTQNDLVVVSDHKSGLPVMTIGTVSIGGVLIFLWYSQRK